MSTIRRKGDFWCDETGFVNYAASPYEVDARTVMLIDTLRDFWAVNGGVVNSGLLIMPDGRYLRWRDDK